MFFVIIVRIFYSRSFYMHFKCETDYFGFWPNNEIDL